MKVYFISGLGADARIFKNIELPPFYQPVFIEWIKPLKDESLVSYASRLSENIDEKEPFILIGLSFGGMIAVEISRIKKPRQLILISSIPCIDNLPFLYKVAGKLQLHRIVPVKFFQQASMIKRLFTAETGEDKKLLRQMIRGSDPEFIKWAFHAVLTWKNRDIPASYIHIHGSADRILPMKKSACTHVIGRAGHMMVVNRAREINRILAQVLGEAMESSRK